MPEEFIAHATPTAKRFTGKGQWAQPVRGGDPSRDKKGALSATFRTAAAMTRRGGSTTAAECGNGCEDFAVKSCPG